MPSPAEQVVAQRVRDERLLLSALLHGTAPASKLLLDTTVERLFEWRVAEHRALANVLERQAVEPTLTALLVAADRAGFPVEVHLALLRDVAELAPTWDESVDALDRLVRASALEQCALVAADIEERVAAGTPDLAAIAELHAWLASEHHRLLRWGRILRRSRDPEAWSEQVREFVSRAVHPMEQPAARPWVALHAGLGASEPALREFLRVLEGARTRSSVQMVTSDTDVGFLRRLRRLVGAPGGFAPDVLSSAASELLHLTVRARLPLGRSEGRSFGGMQVVGGALGLMRARALLPVRGVRYLLLDGVMPSESGPDEIDDFVDLVLEAMQRDGLWRVVIAIDTARDGARRPARARRGWRRVADRVDRFVEHGRRDGVRWQRAWNADEDTAGTPDGEEA